MVLLAVAFAAQAQTKFHDLEANNVKGSVKCIKKMVYGEEMTINFDKDGKMHYKEMSDVKYDANGFIQSCTVDSPFGKSSVTFKWENGRVKTKTTTIDDVELSIAYTYDANGLPTSETFAIMGDKHSDTTCSDYKFDSHGNWISRKCWDGEKEEVETRTLEYYE